jgi:hypothetical protein
LCGSISNRRASFRRNVKALSLDKTESTKELYDALVKRYNDPAEGAGKGSLSDFWEPIPISQYLNPRDFYKPPDWIDVDAALLLDEERGLAALAELAGGRPAYVALHLSEMWKAAATRPDLISLVYRDFPGEGGSHGVFKAVHQWIEEQKIGKNLDLI